ncbi:MAG: AAA family ATPase [Minisyncoccia bacterium]
MAIYFVTGIPGAGKTSVQRELTRREYDAQGTDSLSIWIRRDNREPDNGQSGIQYGTPEWYRTFRWTLEAAVVSRLKKESDDTAVFLCGTPGNAREVAHLFDTVFCLAVDDETLEHRLMSRTGNDYGKAKHQHDDILRWNKTFANDFRALGAVVIDATEPLPKVVDAIVAALR